MKTSNANRWIGYGIYYGSVVACTSFINNYALAVSAPIANNQFVHVAATYDGSQMQLYFDESAGWISRHDRGHQPIQANRS